MNDTLVAKLAHTGFKSEAKLAHTCCVSGHWWLKLNASDVYTLKIQKQTASTQLLNVAEFSTNLFLTFLGDMEGNIVQKTDVTIL